ncbi:hypothetical protein AB832_06790 [Flavobacteriaceae bacterium (ex Bugula neritina AB1)]|nr:hypothetical protein AB832_06790 [Flavobacteriaceae bacterium (ex Bugula neritina AB1)]
MKKLNKLLRTFLVRTSILILLFTPIKAQNDTTLTKAEFQIIELKNHQEKLEDRITNIYRLLGSLTGLAALVSIFAFIRQLIREKNESQRIEKLVSSYDEATRNREEIIEEFLRKNNENIKTTTALLGTFNGIFSLQKNNQVEAKKLIEDIETLRSKIIEDEDEETRKLDESVRYLNTKAMKICFKLSRSNYKVPEKAQEIKGFRSIVYARLKTPRTESRLNPNSYFLLALDLNMRNMFDEALENLDLALNLAKKYKDEEVEDIVFPAKDLTENDLNKWNTKLINICLFHKAIILYNLGKHKEAASVFQEALVYDPNDVLSMIYVPEAMYLGKFEQFERIIEAFEGLLKKIEVLSKSPNWRHEKNEILALLYIKLGNCYFPGTSHLPFKNFESIEKAYYYYKLAYEQNSASYLMCFSLGQASLEMAKAAPVSKQDQYKQNARSLFKKTLRKIKLKIGETNETKILIMLFYINAICMKELGIDLDRIQYYIDKIYEHGKDLPSIEEYRVYSPLTKNDLSYPALRNEVIQFENRLKN